jgi:glucose-6-phosphate-specific signal transduction histidine kinase
MVRLFAEMDWIVTGIKLVALVLGTFIVYLAYKGYRRNNSKPLLHVAFGFALITAATIVEGILYVIIGSELLVALFISTTITVVGFVAIIYSVYSVK